MGAPEERLLIVDDDDQARADYRSALAGLGFAIDEAGDCLTAQARLQQAKYLLALVDMNMPDLDGEMNEQAGIHLTQLIRREHPLTQVIILTNLPSIQHATRMARQGEVYLSKLETGAEALRTAVRERVDEARRAIERIRRAPAPPSEEWGR